MQETYKQARIANTAITGVTWPSQLCIKDLNQDFCIQDFCRQDFCRQDFCRQDFWRQDYWVQYFLKHKQGHVRQNFILTPK